MLHVAVILVHTKQRAYNCFVCKQCSNRAGTLRVNQATPTWHHVPRLIVSLYIYVSFCVIKNLQFTTGVGSILPCIMLGRLLSDCSF